MTEIYIRQARVEESPLQSDLMLFDPDQSKFFVLNPTMAYLWRHCDGNTPLQELLDRLPQAFANADPAQVGSDLRAALDDLLSMGLVTRI